MIKFVHISDLHLARCLTGVGYSYELAGERREAAWNSLLNAIEFSIENGIEYVFITGDIFEREYFTLTDMARLVKIFQKYDNLCFIIAFGNHDPYDTESVFKLVQTPDNVYFFKENYLDFYEFPKDQLRVYGFSWTTSTASSKPELRTRLDSSYTNILLLHGEFDVTEGKYYNFSSKELMGVGYDYIAAGHIHSFTRVADRICYPGIPEPMDFGEQGEKGFVCGIIDRTKLRLNFIPSCKKEFRTINIELNPDDTELSVYEKLAAFSDQKHFYRFVLKGKISLNLYDKLSVVELSLRPLFHYIEMLNDTGPDIELISEFKRTDPKLYEKIVEGIEKSPESDLVKANALALCLELVLSDVIKDEN